MLESVKLLVRASSVTGKLIVPAVNLCLENPIFTELLRLTKTFEVDEFPGSSAMDVSTLTVKSDH